MTGILYLHTGRITPTSHSIPPAQKLRIGLLSLQFRPFGSPGVRTCRVEPGPQGPTISGLTDLTVPPVVMKISSSREKSDSQAARPSGKCGPELSPRPIPLSALPGPTRNDCSFNSEVSQVSELQFAVSQHAGAQPPDRTWFTPSLTQEAPAPFWPEVDSGRGTFWEVLCCGTSVGRRAQRDGSELPAPGFPSVAFTRPPRHCALDAHSGVSGRSVSYKEHIAGLSPLLSCLTYFNRSWLHKDKTDL